MNKFILIGLGNPGKEYAFTRHNAGKLFSWYLAEHPIEGVEAVETECYMNESGSWIAQMLSSRAKGQRSSTSLSLRTLRKLLAETRSRSGLNDLRGSGVRPEDSAPRDPNGLKDKGRKEKIDFPYPLFVAHDDLDIPIGSFKIQFGKGPRQHRGVLSIEGALGTKEFWRVRIGVDARKKEEGKRQREVSGEEYVLQRFSRAERAEVDTLFPQIRKQLRILFRSI